MKTNNFQKPKKQGQGHATPANSRSISVQFVDNRPETIQKQKLQEMANNSLRGREIAQLQKMGDQKPDIQSPRPNHTGLPDNLKAGVENLSGYSMDDVKVHFNSPKPASLQAHAYAQGTDIHLAPGQERHLPHEAWHVVQQKQGRVRPTMQMSQRSGDPAFAGKGNMNINDDAGLEKEAAVMGSKAFQFVDNRHEAIAQRKPQEMAYSPQIKQAAQLQKMVATFQRVRVQDSRDGQFYETGDMGDQEIVGLALQFYQLHNIGELRKIQQAHSNLDISDGRLYMLAYQEPHPRTRARHDLSEGESDNDDMGIAFRSLREDESPLDKGLLPPDGHDRSISARAHITAGSRAKIKSRFISGSRSKKVTGAWASKNKKGRVARFSIPPDLEHHDLTRPLDQDKIFPSGQGSSLNTAKASQEVLIPDSVPSYHIESIYEAESLSVREYEARKSVPARDGQELFRSRTKTNERPRPFALTEIYNRERASEKRLEMARQFWRDEIENIVDQINAQYEDDPEFSELSYDDAIDFISERTDNPNTLDYIENDEELESYLQEIKNAIDDFFEEYR